MEGGRDACRAKQQTQTASDSDVGRGAVTGTQAETDVPKEEEELEYSETRANPRFNLMVNQSGYGVWSLWTVLKVLLKANCICGSEEDCKMAP